MTVVARFHMPIIEFRQASLKEFVEFWLARYVDKNEPRYIHNIRKPLTSERIMELFFFKNGGPLSEKKRKSIERNYISKISDLEQLSENCTAEHFLKQFSTGGAIWRIFWLHCCRPDRFPIYDQHVHRAMCFIKTGLIEEIPNDNQGKIDLFLDQYIHFFNLFSELDSRNVDKALWTFGKYLKKTKTPIPTIFD